MRGGVGRHLRPALGALRGARAAAIAFSSLMGCAPAAPALAPTEGVVTAHLMPPQGTALVQACTPTGPELCFNAIDDNCNGVIDEGCGIKTGLLQFTLAWDAPSADLDLALVTPALERVPGERTRASPSGFHLDRNCPGDDGCGGQNVENVYYDGSGPAPRGHYSVEISLVDLHGAEQPVKAHLGARLGARTVGFDVALAPGDDAKKTFGFDVL